MLCWYGLLPKHSYDQGIQRPAKAINSLSSNIVNTIVVFNLQTDKYDKMQEFYVLCCINEF